VEGGAYGNTDRIAAGHPEFKARYLAGMEETRVFGKRPDLLLFAAGFAAIASGSGYSIETPAKSQEKSTIMIPITQGLQVGKATGLPTFAAEHRTTELGRHDAYVVPCGGGFVLEPSKVQQVLLAH